MTTFPRVLFDEAHNEAWTIRREHAEAMNQGHPDDNGYTRAAGLLRGLGHSVAAHTAGPLTAALLAGVDVFVIAHPSAERWERVKQGGNAEDDASGVAEPCGARRRQAAGQQERARQQLAQPLCFGVERCGHPSSIPVKFTNSLIR